MGRTRPNDSKQPVSGLGLVAALIGAVLILVLLVDPVLSARHSTRKDDLAAERKNLAESGKKASEQLQAAKLDFQKADAAARKVERRVNPIKRKIKTAERTANDAERAADSIRDELSAWVEVPYVAGMSQWDAQSTLTELNLASDVQEIEGTCADYRGHFEQAGLGWFDVVRQDPDPGWKVPPYSTVTVSMWDYASGWEYDCIDLDLDL